LMFSIRREIWFPDFQGPGRSIARALLTNLTAHLWALTLARAFSLRAIFG
jgi:hypothetical protein